MQKNFFVFFLLVVVTMTTRGQVSTISDLIKNRNSLQEKAPREKLYLHLDKQNYLATDTIWYKAYLTKALNNNYSTLSGVMYLELFDGKNELVKRYTTPTKYGFAWGQIALDPQMMLSGTYVLRAYTNWMRNFGDSLLFEREIRIGNSDNSVAVASGSSKSQSKINSPDLQFLPEGGVWVNGIKQRLGFKAINEQGKGIDLSGKILNDKNEVVATFNPIYKGMGFVDFTPNAGEIYSAVLQNGSRYPLPKTKLSGIILQVNNVEKSDSLQLTINGTQDVLTTPKNYFLIGESRGMICFGVKLRLKGQPRKINIAKDAFPTGISRLILLDEQLKPINERLAFINHHDQLKIALNPSKQKYSIRDKVDLKINVTDQFGKPLRGAFSIAVTDDQQVLKDSLNDENIVNYQLLTSDLRGNVESPNYYFSGQHAAALDVLLLTQGWVSYDLPTKMKFSAESDYQVSGKVTNVFNKPMARTSVMLFGSGRRPIIIDTLTDESGRFTFNKLPVFDSDSASFVIRALNKNKKTFGVGLEVYDYKALDRPSRILSSKSTHLDTVFAAFTTAQRDNYKRGGGSQLQEVVINSKKAIRGSKNLNGPGEADYILTDSELSKEPRMSLESFLMRNLKGFRAGYPKRQAAAGLSGKAGQGIQFDPSKARDYVLNNKKVRLIIDGIDADMSFNMEREAGTGDHYDFLREIMGYYTADDIRGIEVMQSPRYNQNYMANFAPDLRFRADPVNDTDLAFIAITTKNGDGPFIKRRPGIYMYRPLKVNYAEQFYSPLYTAKEKPAKPTDFRSTIYWNPNITTNEKGEANVSFFCSDQKGKYTIWIEGTTMSDQFGVKVQKVVIE
ncbi:carboxypeptidase regulatory-like domain-containing protein [Pedobacter hiemivivus]|uniref:Carboxypeptidase regulatory-like domain-containing protein n=1 Tax=Pedobacter hiemivivus TaxID=2530454 RepID=A0A4U1GIE3_9SPHI|nr:carboxypeptidase-like regulatory domain-containing protein [Pedobacter hiemivivus]TKC61202.1 carboxypeptidase regulatory-like domain-containing protein [Pedobacter hiemivivus]